VGYIEKDNPERARTFALEIRAKTNGLSQFPEMGRPGRVPGTRELVVHSHYIIAYRIREDGVQILRVHHVARRWPQHL
jgi:toxin ParE1/3/4